MKELELSQHIHNSFWGTERPCESQFVNHFCYKSRRNSEKSTAWHWHFQDRNLSFLLSPWLWRDLDVDKGWWERKRLNNLESELKYCSYFGPSIIFCWYFNSTKTGEKSFECYFLSSQGDWSTACWWLHGGFAPKVVGCLGLDKRASTFSHISTAVLASRAVFLNPESVENCSCESSDKSQENRARKIHKGSFNLFSSVKAGCTTLSSLTTTCLTCS